ncbi:unnamed protein product [Sphagnum jensenii]|uniref:Uncharacterized protein n=1 Tax=Sphagnum jensenii TaxID=128206 RepID=A0ABP1BR06_9BRYO
MHRLSVSFYRKSRAPPLNSPSSAAIDRCPQDQINFAKYSLADRGSVTHVTLVSESTYRYEPVYDDDDEFSLRI